MTTPLPRYIERSPERERWIIDKNSREIWHLDGIPWFLDRPVQPDLTRPWWKFWVPNSVHEHRPQTIGWAQLWLVHRCRCGATSLGDAEVWTR